MGQKFITHSVSYVMSHNSRENGINTDTDKGNHDGCFTMVLLSVLFSSWQLSAILKFAKFDPGLSRLGHLMLSLDL